MPTIRRLTLMKSPFSITPLNKNHRASCAPETQRVSHFGVSHFGVSHLGVSHLSHRGDEKPFNVATILRGVLSAPCRQLPWNQNDEMLVRNARIRSCVLIMPWHAFMIVSCSFKRHCGVYDQRLLDEIVTRSSQQIASRGCSSVRNQGSDAMILQVCDVFFK